MMKLRFQGLALVVALFGFLLILTGTAGASDFQKLMDSRTARLWLEGQRLGDMVIGARAELNFVYVDRKLVQALTDDYDAPEWLRWHAQHLGSPEAKKKALFVLRFETRKPWDFRISDIRVGNYSLREEDGLTRSAFTPTGPLACGTKGTLAFVVPAVSLGKGKTVLLGYGEERVEWKKTGR
jgi:hypothetical protein